MPGRPVPTAIRSFQSAIGPVVAAASPRGVLSLRLGAAGAEGPQDLLVELQREVTAFLAGRLNDFSVPLDPTGLSPFRVEAYHATMQIPYGRTRSYAWLGAQVGSSARAAGMAMAGCPYLLLVPCQRVIKADGSLGGFGGREDLKVWLLDLERRHARRSGPRAGRRRRSAA